MTVLMRAMQPADWPLARSDRILGCIESVHVAPARFVIPLCSSYNLFVPCCYVI